MGFRSADWNEVEFFTKLSQRKLACRRIWQNHSYTEKHKEMGWSGVCVCLCVCVLGLEGQPDKGYFFRETLLQASKGWQMWCSFCFWKTNEGDASSVVFPIIKSCPTLCNPMNCSTPSLFFTIFLSLSKFMSVELVMPSSLLILCWPLLLLPSIFPCLRVFSNELAFTSV